jgi:hypothetical protein
MLQSGPVSQRSVALYENAIGPKINLEGTSGLVALLEEIFGPLLTTLFTNRSLLLAALLLAGTFGSGQIQAAEPKQRTTQLFWDWRGKDTPRDCWPRWAVRDGDWKLVMDDQNRRELYRLPDDWSEQHDLAKERPDKVAELTAKLTDWKASLPKEPAAQCISKEGRARRGVRTPKK